MNEIQLVEADLFAMIGQGAATLELYRRRLQAKDEYIQELEHKLKDLDYRFEKPNA